MFSRVYVLAILYGLFAASFAAAQTCGSTGLPGYLSSNGQVCCPTSCLRCGGDQCDKLNGGASNCCQSDILKANQSCATKGRAPCVVSSSPPPATCASTGVSGYLSSSGKACCPRSCGRCGGANCDKLSGGAKNCCEGNIVATNVACSASGTAPCVVTPNQPDQSAKCGSTGISGYLSSTGNTCCPTSCTRCGGTSCDKLNGGANSCCEGNIIRANQSCATKGAAPCVVTSTPTKTCGSTGVSGVLSNSGNACCPVECTRCGGSQCNTLPGGADSCCEGNIIRANQSCSTKRSAPCVVSGGTSKPTTPAVTCGSTGVNGILSSSGRACCPASCTRCGGSNCNTLPGGADSCCEGNVLAANQSCGTKRTAPCVATTATIAPTTAPPTTATPTTTAPTTATPTTTAPTTTTPTTATPTTTAPTTATPTTTAPTTPTPTTTAPTTPAPSTTTPTTATPTAP